MKSLRKNKLLGKKEAPEEIEVPHGAEEAEEQAKENIIFCDNLVKIYKTKETEVVALQGLDLAVKYGEITAVIGNSGSGKSTLLNMLGGLDTPSAGLLMVDGKNLGKMTEAQRIAFKRDTVGFVWQNNARNLLPYLSAVENVEMPMRLNGNNNRNRALELLDMVQMTHRKNNRLGALSGGEQQRIAIAIAMANNPRLILADEPTGAVDSKTAAHILEVFREVNRTMGTTVLIVTHDRAISRQVDRVVAIRDGRTSSEMLNKISYADVLGELVNTDDETHVEFAVLDRAGRLQVPKEYLEEIGAGDTTKLVVKVEEGQIVLRSPGAMNP